jgi:cytochrome c peroxidase
MPPGLPNNVDRDPPLDRAPGAAPALSAAEINDLIAFLRTLTDADVDPARVGGTIASARR